MRKLIFVAALSLLVISGCKDAGRQQASVASNPPQAVQPVQPTVDPAPPSLQVDVPPPETKYVPLPPPKSQHFVLRSPVEPTTESSPATALPTPPSPPDSQQLILPPPPPKNPPQTPPTAQFPSGGSSIGIPPSPPGFTPNPLRMATAPKPYTPPTTFPVGGSAGSPKSNPFRSSFLADPDEPETFTTRSITATAKAPETSLQEEPAAAAQSEGSYVPSLPLPAPPPAVPATSANPPTMSTDDNKSFVPSPPILAPPHAPIDTPVEAATAPKPASPSGGSFQVPPFATSLDQGSTLAPSGESAGAGKASTDNIERNDSTLVKVFYATDRNQLSAEEEAQAARQTFLFPAACILIGVMILCVVFMVRGPHRVMATAAFGCASVIFLVGYIAHQHLPQAFEMVAANSPTQSIEYGSDRGVLHLGMCEVSIPRSHKPGELESPSIWRLEVRENEERHIVLERVVRQCDSEYYRLIKERVNQSPRKDLFVFVHGYNVTFEDAARRTAQMAFDLKYDGAPIFYSWPSQGELLDYSVDENNVAWTVPHLKKFLLDLSKNSDAKAINLIAHSMGNRALTAALKELAYEVRSEKAAYNEVILAAPDIDADIFKNDIAPAIAKSANRVTLYASSRDRALAASQLVHGYPRAGDSGDGLVIVAGIDTVDVSKIDTTLLGHSYYSGNEPIIDDIFALLSESRAAATRPWLKSAQLGGGSYWVFGEKAATASLIAPRK